MDGGREHARDKIRGVLAEADRDAAARLAEAEAALAGGEVDEARRLASTLLDGPRAADALALLDRMAPGGTSFAASLEADGPIPPAVPAVSGHASNARKVFAVACLTLVVAIGTALAAGWDGLIERLGRAPAPQRTTVAASLGEATEDDVIGRARRLFAAGRVGEAMTLLGSVPPEHPSYPLARQLRAQVASAGGERGPGIPE